MSYAGALANLVREGKVSAERAAQIGNLSGADRDEPPQPREPRQRRKLRSLRRVD